MYSFKHTSHVFVFIIFCNLFDIANHLSLMRKKYFLLFCLVDASLTMKFVVVLHLSLSKKAAPHIGLVKARTVCYRLGHLYKT